MYIHWVYIKYGVWSGLLSIPVNIVQEPFTIILHALEFGSLNVTNVINEEVVARLASKALYSASQYHINTYKLHDINDPINFA